MKDNLSLYEPKKYFCSRCKCWWNIREWVACPHCSYYYKELDDKHKPKRGER